MYSKLFARITESSLMEEPINVRYTFVMLIAIADPEGYVVGTDVAICRRLNMSVEEFTECAKALMQPDPASNSKEYEGRRIIESDGERGYLVVNYSKYRDMKDETERREYMKQYMRNYRGKGAKLTRVNRRKQMLTQAEADANEPEKAFPEPLRTLEFQTAWKEWAEYRKQAKLAAYTPIGARKQLSALSKLGSERAVAAINHSISNAYQGIFEPSGNGNGNGKPASKMFLTE